MVLCLAFCPRRARAIVYARIDTLRVTALLVVRTIVVAAALDDRTLYHRISAISAQTSALCVTRYGVAFGVDSARVVIQARIYAISVDASLTRFTLGINSTSDRSTGNVRISFVSILARANSSVVLYHTCTVITAVARIPALSIDTSLLIRAFRITGTLRRSLQHDSFTFTVHIWHVQFRTFANHGSHRNRIQHGTLG